jgi:uncharacterized protein (TIGR02246 family)
MHAPASVCGGRSSTYDAAMRRLDLLAAVSLLIALAAWPRAARADDVADIRAELARQTDAWNRGDLDGYLAGYARAPTTIMVASTLLRGWDAIAARYRDKYGDKARMGHVSFSDLEVRLLDGGYALAIGRWALARAATAGGPVGGWFSLTLQKTRDGWRIIVDHTS